MFFLIGITQPSPRPRTCVKNLAQSIFRPAVRALEASGSMRRAPIRAHEVYKA